MTAVLAVLGTALPSFAQLTYEQGPRSSTADAIASDSAFINEIKDPNVVGNPTYVAAGLTFSLVPNLSLNSLTVGSGALGTFIAEVSYVYSSENDTDSFGATDATLTQNEGLYAPFTGHTAVDQTFTWDISDPTNYATVNFWANDGQYPGTVYQNNSNFLTYQAVDLSTNRIDTLLFYDDRNNHDPSSIDHNDGIFLLQQNVLPIGLSAVPEPSTYGMLGVLLLGGIVLFKRKSIFAPVI